jgi:di/tricarboxylate transporter
LAEQVDARPSLWAVIVLLTLGTAGADTETGLRTKATGLGVRIFNATTSPTNLIAGAVAVLFAAAFIGVVELTGEFVTEEVPWAVIVNLTFGTSVADAEPRRIALTAR